MSTTDTNQETMTMTAVMHRLSKMTTDELVDVLVGRRDMPAGMAFDGEHAWHCVIELLDKRMTHEQMAALEDEILASVPA